MKSSTVIAALVLATVSWSSRIYANEVSKGRDVYLSYCMACHAFACDRDGAEAYSPRLSGLFGRKAGGLEDFTGYSEGLRNSEVIWGDVTLTNLFIDPTAVVSGIALPDYHKVDQPEAVKPLIAFLKTEDQSVDIFCGE